MPRLPKYEIWIISENCFVVVTGSQTNVGGMNCM